MKLLKEKIISITEVFSGTIPKQLYYYSEDFKGFEIITKKQTLILMIDKETTCYENPGYFFCNDNYMSFIGAELISLSITDTSLNEAIMIKNNNSLSDLDTFKGKVMFVNIETSRGTLQFVAYNEHNGDYGKDAIISVNTLYSLEVL